MKEQQLYEKIYEQREQLNNLIGEYWRNYTGYDTWYFWFNLAALLIPLIILYFKIDKKRIFEISFFGYTAHILWSNIDTILSTNNYLVHTHSLSYLLPAGITMTAVIIPVLFMFIYQYCTNNGKNFYFYIIIISLLLGLGFGSISQKLELFKMHKGMNLFYLVLIDIAVAYISYWFTKLFLKISGKIETS